MLGVPLKAVPSQTLNIVLNGQSCQLNVYQKPSGLYIDVLVNGALIIGGVICQNVNRIVRSLYLGFSGDFVFFDNQGSSPPNYAGLGTRFSLVYVFPNELPAGVG